MKKMLLFVLLLMLSVNAFAQERISYERVLHSMDIIVDTDGFGRVVEKHYLNFPTSIQLERFRQKSNELSTNLTAWKNFDNRFVVHIGSEKNIVPGTASIAFIEAEEDYLQFEYVLNQPIMRNASETSRSIEFELIKGVMSAFIQQSFFIIPPNTVIVFVLPSQTTARQEEISLESNISILPDKTFVSWQGFQKKSDLRMRYTYWKQIAPSFSLAFALKEFTENSSPLIQGFTAAIVAFLIGLVYIYRQPIVKKVTKFMIQHSEFEHVEEEEFE